MEAQKLIESLRICSDETGLYCTECIFENTSEIHCKYHLMKKAADAIEKLQSQLSEYHKFDGFLAAHGMFKEEK